MGILQMTGKVLKSVLVVFILLGSSAYAQVINMAKYIKSNSDGSQTLLNHVPLEVAIPSTSLVSHAASNQMLSLRVVLPSKDPAGLDTFIKNVYTPKSPMYHKFLTPQQFDQEFGASAVDSAVVIAYLKSQGFTVNGQSKNGFIISVAGPVSKVESAFKVKINNYKKKDGTLFFSPDSNPTIPPQVTGKVYSIVGMDNVARFHPHLHLNKQITVAKAPISTIGVKSTISAGSLIKPAASPAYLGIGGYMGPSDITTAYNLNSVSSTGSGQNLALYELDGYVPSDITTFEGFYGLPNVPLTNVYTDGANGSAGSNAVEDVLDIDVAISTSPGLSGITVYEAPDLGSAWLDQWNTIASSSATVISCSWGLYEAASYPFYDHTVFAEMAAQGQTIFSSSGDAGAYDNCDGGSLPTGSPATCTINGIGGGIPLLTVDDPASDPYITGVGISVMTENGNGTYYSERGSLYGGGGISAYWSIPTFQQGLTLAPGSLASTTMRNVPDVVFTADPATAYGIYLSVDVASAGWYAYWGSSAASPIWAAFMTRVNQARVAAGQTVIGYLNPSLYSIANSTSGYANDLHDISTGNNSFYPAQAGYDNATGLGSFNGANLFNDLVPPPIPVGLSGTAGNHQVSLSWTSSAGAVSYNIYRGTSSHGENPVPIINVGTNSYVDTGLTNSTTYYYVVNAVSSVGITSGDSVEASATPQPPTVPTAPLGVTATAGYAQATVSFSPPASNGGSPILSYAVTSNPVVGVPTSGASSPITVTGLTNGTPYTFTVTATNAVGTSVASLPSNTVTPSVVAAPSSLSVTILGAKVGGQIIYGGTNLVWKQSISPGILQSKIYRATGVGAYVLIATLSPSASYVDRSVVKGTVYNYEVSAVNSLGESPPSNIGTVNY